jgi:hypothetical protein
VALAQKAYDTRTSTERAPLQELLSSLNLDGVLIQAKALHTNPGVFRWCLAQGADVLLTVKSNQKTLYRQLGCQFEGKRQIPFTATDHEKRRRRDTVWQLQAKEAPEQVRENWPGSAWIVEVITDTVAPDGNRGARRNLFLTSVPDAKSPATPDSATLEH